MKRGTALFLLGGIVVAGLIAAALFVVLGSGDDGGASSDHDVATVPVADQDAAAKARSRERVSGTGALFGVVVRGEKRKPVAGQPVALAGLGEQPLTTLTDTAGAFVFEGLPPGGPYDVSAVAAGYGTVSLRGIALERDERRDLGMLVLDVAVRALVHVRSWSDEPIGGARVSAYTAVDTDADYDWSRAMAQIAQTPVAVQTVTAGADGDAVFPELAVGHWTFVAEKPGYARSGMAGLRLRNDGREPDPITLRLEPGGSLTGRVLEPTGDPVAGAIVIAGSAQDAWNPQSAPLGVRDTSGADGVYALAGLPPGAVLLRVVRQGAPPVPVLTVRIPDVTTIDLVLREGGTVTGRVTAREDGSPIAGADVAVSTWTALGSGTMRGRTDDDGRFVVGGVTPGTLGDPVVEAEGWAAVPDAHAQSTVEPGGVVERDVEMVPAARVVGTVTGPEGPVAGAKVGVMGGDVQFGIAHKTADAGGDGRFEIEGLAPGTYVITAGAPGLQQEAAPENPWMELQSGASGRWSFRLAAGDTREIDVVLEGGVTVTGRVEGTGGDPLAGAVVSASTESGFTPGVEMPTARSAADGTFRLTGVRRGVGTLTATLAAHVPADDPLRLDTRTGEDVTDLVLRMQRAPVVAGNVVGSDGVPVPHAYVQVAWEAPAEPSDGIVIMQGGDAGDVFAGTQRHPVRSDGTYEVPLEWTNGLIRVRAGAPGHASRTSEHVTLSARRDRYEIDLQMETGAVIAGHVVAEETGEALSGAHVTLARVETPAATGMIVLPGFGGDDSTPIVAVTDASGAFSIARLEATSYRVTARTDGRVSNEKTVRAPAGDVTLPLTTALTIQGVVVDAGGTPLQGLTVAAAREGAERVASMWMSEVPGTGTTDAQGRFTLRDLAPGSYVLTVSAGWGATSSIEPFTSPLVQAGSTGVRLEVASGLEVAGRVLDEDDEPVGGAQIYLQGDGQWRHAQSQADGTFSIGGLPSDGAEYTLSVQVQTWSGRSLRPARRTVRAGETTLEIRLLAGLTIEGRVRREDGAALPDGASIDAEAVGEGADTGLYSWNHAAFDADGVFRIAGLGEGTYRLRLDADDDGRALVLRSGATPVSAGTTGLELVAWFGARIVGRVRADGATSLDGASVQAAPSEGGNVTSTPVAADGSFEVTGLIEGTSYDLTSQAPGRMGMEVKAVAGQAELVELTLRTGVSATGRILGANGEPLAAAQLWVSGPGSVSSMSNRTDADGRFTIEGLEQDAEYQVSVFVQSGSGFSTRSAGTIRGGQRDANLRLTPEDE